MFLSLYIIYIHIYNESLYINHNTIIISSLPPFVFGRSDILLYVSAYPALVQTLKELLDPSFFPVPTLSGNKNPKFIMSWNRRMKESIQFFDLMTDAGFQHRNEGKCVYTFWKEEVA
jgi:hypothetical protein